MLFFKRAFILNKFNNHTVTLRSGWVLDDKSIKVRMELVGEIADIIESKTWKILEILFSPKRIIVGGKRVKIKNLLHMTTDDLSKTLHLIQASKSYRIIKNVTTIKSRYVRKSPK